MVKLYLKSVVQRYDIADFRDDVSVRFGYEMLIGFRIKRKIVLFTGHHSAAFTCEDVQFILSAYTDYGGRIEVALLDDVVRVLFKIRGNGVNEPFAFDFHRISFLIIVNIKVAKSRLRIVPCLRTPAILSCILNSWGPSPLLAHVGHAPSIISYRGEY